MKKILNCVYGYEGEMSELQLFNKLLKYYKGGIYYVY
jgi:hypothetical protein